MKDRGFTLIELLAVITILAIIALITVPIVIDTIEDSRRASDMRSGELYVDTVNQAIAKKNINGDFYMADGWYEINKEGNICLNDECTEEIEVKAKNKPTGGRVYIEKNGITDVDYLIIKNGVYGYNDSKKFEFLYDTGAKFTVTFNTDGGSSIASVTVSPNTKITKPNKPYKPGYKFLGWQLNGNTYDFNTPVTSSITLTAVWEETQIYTMVIGGDFNTKIKSLVSGTSVSSTNVEDNVVEQVEFYSNGELPEGYTLSELQALPSTVVSDTGETIKAYYDNNKKSIYVYSEGEIQWNNNSSYMFYYFTSLISVEIPEGITSIGQSAFYGCSSLTSITIPSGVTSIGQSAFCGCSSLTSITIPNSVTSISRNAFIRCENLSSITVEAGNAVYEDRGSNAIIEKNTNKLIVGCKNTIIPNSVTSIGESAFYECSSLTSITIPNSVTSIEKFAFSGCSGLTSITIPNSVTSIEEFAFSGCSGLTNITLGSGLTSIGHSAFRGCSSLASITIPNSVTSIKFNAFSSSGLTSITIPASVTSIEHGIFSHCNSLSSIIVASGNTRYEDRGSNAIIEKSTNRLIAGCKNTIIPNSVTSIGTQAFSGFSSLTSITIPNSVTSIGLYAFSYSGLTSITIPSSVTSITARAFEDCTNLTSATFENPDGWWIGDYNATSGTSLDLSNTSTNATYLKSTYLLKYWKRSN